MDSRFLLPRGRGAWDDGPREAAGVAAKGKDGAWDLDHPALEGARAFLTALFRDEG